MVFGFFSDDPIHQIVLPVREFKGAIETLAFISIVESDADNRSIVVANGRPEPRAKPSRTEQSRRLHHCSCTPPAADSFGRLQGILWRHPAAPRDRSSRQ